MPQWTHPHLVMLAGRLKSREILIFGLAEELAAFNTIVFVVSNGIG